MPPITRSIIAFSLGLSLAAAPLSRAKETAAAAVPTGRIDARMMRQADVSATQIAFVYAGDIWVAPKTGGTAVRLSSPRGEESFPRFSPDGSQIAFQELYDDVYTIGADGSNLTQYSVQLGMLR